MSDFAGPKGHLSAHELRFLRLLSKAKGQSLRFRLQSGKFIIVTENREHTFDPSLRKRLEQRGCIKGNTRAVSVTPRGKLLLSAAMQHSTDKGLAQSQCTEMREISIDGQKSAVRANIDESPLSRLYKLRKRNGEQYISDHEFLAGERLRSDFHRGQLEPRISANWSMTAGHAGKGGKSGTVELSDTALDARGRLHDALDTIGPDLSGVAIDICCFLKGLEAVERERKWPPRSAKLMLKTALGGLARHYGLIGHSNRRKGKLASWGALDYRPSI